MFRRPGKNPLEDEPIYQDEQSPFKYGNTKSEPGEIPPRIFDPPHQGHAPQQMTGHHPTPANISHSTTAPMASPLASPMEEENWGGEKTIPHHFGGLVSEEDPETTLGEGVTFRGQLSFERLLRIDGIFEGDLLSQGKVVVGPKGKVKANLNLREAVIEGEVEGNITVQEKLELRGEAIIKGDITAKSLCVDEGVTLIGVVSISPENSTDHTEY